MKFKIKLGLPKFLKIPRKILGYLCVLCGTAWALYTYIPLSLWLPAIGLILLLIYWSGQSRKYAMARSMNDRWRTHARHVWTSPNRDVQPSVFVFGYRKPMQPDEIAEMEEKKKKEIADAQAEP